VSIRATGATAVRVLTQLRRDPRTVALLLLVPAFLVILMRYVFDARPDVFDRIGPALLGLFPFVSMFIVTSITMLRERVSGTLERLMTMPLAKADLLTGYGIAFGLMAALQAATVSAVAIWLLDLDLLRSAWLIAALAIGNAVLGMALGLFASAFARTEFQAVQFIPAFVFPQILLCGLFVPREQMAPVLEVISYALPLTYAYDALSRAASSPELGSRFAVDVAVIVGATIVAIGLAAATLRRRTD
jgi:ABC-2 type transport system permease protein